MRCTALAWLVLLAACDEGGPTPAEEVAGELRALRLALAQQPMAAGTAPAVDLAAAMAPMREALTALAAEQRQLTERQVALTQELQRWSALLVQSSRDETAQSAAALTQRLTALEADLKRQDERHRATETLLQGALERTADQLDTFLQRLQNLQPPRKQDAPPPGGAGGADGIVQGRPTTARWWWLLLTGLGAGVATFFLRRAPSRMPVQPPVPVAAAPPLAAVVGGERSVEEIWAAAALLGEAVGRLRQTAAGSAPGDPVAEPTAVAPPEPTPAATSLAVASRAEAAPVPAGAPVLVALLPSHAPAADVLAALGGERSVLRRPAPTAAVQGGHLEVRCCVVPGTSVAERARIVQRLRDAARQPRSSAD